MTKICRYVDMSQHQFCHRGNYHSSILCESIRIPTPLNIYAMLIRSSTAGISSIDQYVGTGGVSRSIADEVDIGALQLLRVAVSSHGDHAHPEVLYILGHEVRQAGVDVARGDGVDAGEVAPLVGQRLGHVDAACLGDVVGGLLLGEVGDVAGHGGRDDERAGAALFEVRADRFGAVEGSVEIGLDHLVPGFGGAVENAFMLPSHQYTHLRM